MRDHRIHTWISRVFLLFFVLPAPDTYAQWVKSDTTTVDNGFEYLFKPRKGKIKPDSFDTISLEDYYDMSLEQLESVKAAGVPGELEIFINSLISVSTQKSLPVRYSPNIVTLVTEEEIRNLGARDLMDVLQLIPGFHFAQDQRGNVGPGLRGNWANEGKILLMIDGKEMNDLYTAHLYFGNHYSPDMISRIEIIRGPGSAIHGGFAEFGVINIVTRKAADETGLSVHSGHGWMGSGANRNTFSVFAGKRWKQAALNGFIVTGQAQRSNRMHYGFYSSEADSAICLDTLGVGRYAALGGNSGLSNTMLNLDFSWKGLHLSNLTDFYRVTDVTSLDAVGKRPLKPGHATNAFGMKYKIRAGHNLAITPSLNFRVQTPWEKNTAYARSLEENPEHADSIAIAVARMRIGLNFNYDVSHRINIIGGMESFSDHAINHDTLAGFYKNDAPETYVNTAYYCQAIFRLNPFNLFVGSRYEVSSLYPPAFSPRAGITRKFRKAHVKLLVSDAYRAPTLGNIFYSFDGSYDVLPDSSGIGNLGRGLRPEKTLVIEAEVGYQFGKKTFLTANIFDITTRNPIVFSYYQDENISNIYGQQAGLLVYQNFNRSGTSGVEIEFMFKDSWGYLKMNYATYSVAFKPRLPAFSVSTFHRDPRFRHPVNEDYLLGFPRHKFNINWCYYIRDNFTVNVSSIFSGRRYGYDVDITGPDIRDVDGKLIRMRPSLVSNLFFRYDNLYFRGLEAGIGIYDIFNRGTDYLQPYFGMQPPLPGPSRELIFKLSYAVPVSGQVKPEKSE